MPIRPELGVLAPIVIVPYNNNGLGNYYPLLIVTQKLYVTSYLGSRPSYITHLVYIESHPRYRGNK